MMSSFSKRYCSVPGCRTYKSQKNSLHLFPKDDKLKKDWQRILKIAKPISPYMSVCSQHFLETDYKTLKSPKAKRLLKGWATPSLKLPSASNSIKKHPIDRSKRKWLATEDSQDLEVNSTWNVHSMPLTQMYENMEDDEIAEEAPKLSIPEQCTEMSLGISDKSTQTEQMDHLFQEYLDDKKLYSFTGITFDIFNAMETCVANVMIENNIDTTNLRMKILLVLIKLKVNMSFVCLSVLFNLSPATCSRYFYTTLAYLATALKPLICWPHKEEIRANMPKCFEKFEDTRVVLDCTEVQLQKCQCVKCRIKRYGGYKETHTVKFLIGVSPCGLITFCSSRYGGKISDEAIVLKENLLGKCDPHDAIMVDEGFMIEKECKEKFLKLIRPPFWKNKARYSKKNATATADIARARVHVERALQRIKSMGIVNSQFPCYLVPCIDDVMTIICAIVNLASPIFVNDKFDDI